MALKTTFLVPLLAFTIQNVISQGMPGGLTPQNPSDPSYMESAWKAAKDVNERASNSMYMMVPIKVVQVQTQVVAGINQNMEILYGDSTCRRGAIATSAVSAANCQLMPNGNRALYNVQLYARPWENYEQFTVTKIRDVAPGEQI
ncbi:unnamed protein product [Cylicocyclus nassatus]|uniref:Cystatin domain-containing protein n=1 Tax=Cylicocyclus nassatus TaxID=53992 RepID=A0AA36H493_CYLNA|nr:unnamed protein product [Cylicocyclus nassatus]